MKGLIHIQVIHFPFLVQNLNYLPYFQMWWHYCQYRTYLSLWTNSKILFSIGWHHSKENTNVYPITFIHHFFVLTLWSWFLPQMALNKCKLIMNIFAFKTLKGLVNLIFLGYKWWCLNDFSNRGSMVTSRYHYYKTMVFMLVFYYWLLSYLSIIKIFDKNDISKNELLIFYTTWPNLS